MIIHMVDNDRVIARIEGQKEPYCIYKALDVRSDYVLFWSSLRKMEISVSVGQVHETHLFGKDYEIELRRVVQGKEGLVAEIELRSSCDTLEFKRLMNRGAPA